MIKGKASSDAIGQILDRLSSDNDFREQLLGDPKAALASYGLDVDESKVPTKRALPSKETIKASRDQLNTSIQGNLGLILFVAV